jgi:hypothetical protein
MENPSSPLDTLRQLKEMLDAGALTPAEFEALKQRLVLTPAVPGAAPEPAATPVLPVAPPTPASGDAPVAPPVNNPLSQSPKDEALPLAYEARTPAWTSDPAAQPLFTSASAGSFSVPADAPGYGEDEFPADEPATELAGPAAERNSSLGLVLAIAGVLVFLAVVAYLGFTRPTTDEHLTSISQTAADSLSTTIETGPQVAPLPATTAVPETVRVAPTNPAPVIQPRPVAPITDSVAPTTKSPAADSASGQ